MKHSIDFIWEGLNVHVEFHGGYHNDGIIKSISVFAPSGREITLSKKEQSDIEAKAYELTSEFGLPEWMKVA